MNITALKQVATQNLHKGLHVTKHFSPELLTGVGVIGVVAAAVLASRATLKLEPTLNKTREAVDYAKSSKADAEALTDEDSIVVTKTYSKDLTRAYFHGTVDIVKLYGPSVALGVFSIGCIIGGNTVLRKQNVALAAGYKVLEQGFATYRKRIVEELGEDKERDIYLGLKDEVVTNVETGKKETIKVVTASGMPSPYARFFDEGSSQWSPDSFNNLSLLKGVQNMANDRLNYRGYVFLNDVYKDLGLEITAVGQQVGWALSEDGDNYIDFGLYSGTTDAKRAFVNGDENVFLLDFNVDGYILDKLESFSVSK
jgi:hypothetical protein